MKNTKKIKSFRISKITQYKLTKLKNQWNISEGKTIEKIIDATYYKLFGNHQYNKEQIEIANTEWIGKF